MARKDPAIPTHDQVPLAQLDPDSKEHEFFVTCCKVAEIPPSRRQMKKWRRREGLAWATRKQAQRLEEEITE